MSALVPVVFKYSNIPAPQGSATIYGEFTSSVLSASFDYGKTNYTDPVGLPTASIVIRNDNNEAKRFEIGTWISITLTANSGAGSQLIFGFLVEAVSYNDAPGSLKGATATLELISPIAMLGRMNVTNMVFASAKTFLQLNNFNSASGGRSIASGSGGTTMGGYMTFSQVPGWTDRGVTLGGRTYSGTVLQFLQTAVTTDNSIVTNLGPYMTIVSHTDHDLYLSTASLTFDRTVSSSTIGYESLTRDFYDSELANQVTVTPTGLSGQTASNLTSMALYDVRTYSRQTYDNATATGASLASWLAYVMADRASQNYTIRFTAEGQNQTALSLLFQQLYAFKIGFKIVTLPPGATSTLESWVYVVGMRFEMSPDRTVIEMTLQPANAYCPAKVDSATYAQLTNTGTSRKNLLPNPSAEDNTTGFIGTYCTLASGVYPYTFIGVRSVQATISSTAGLQNVVVGDGEERDGRLIVKASTTYRFSAYVFTPTTNSANTSFRCRAVGYDISGASTTSANGTTTATTRGQWTRLDVSYTTSATTVRVWWAVDSMNTLAIGQVFYVDNCMVEESGSLNEYFDGSMRPAEWLGTRNNSESLLEYGYFRFGRNAA